MPVTEQDIQAINAKASALVGLRAWKVFQSIGSMINFYFGNAVEHEGGYIFGEWGIRIEHAAWRLETSTEFVLGSGSSRAELMTGIKRLEQLAVLSVDVCAPAFDTIICFEDDYTLSIFPIYTNYRGDHWLLYTPDNHVLVVGPNDTWGYFRSDEVRSKQTQGTQS